MIGRIAIGLMARGSVVLGVLAREVIGVRKVLAGQVASVVSMRL